MTREDQIKKALKLLKPADRAACVKYLNDALDDLEKTKTENQLLDDIVSKESRKALDAYCRALRRAQFTRNGLSESQKKFLIRSARSTDMAR